MSTWENIENDEDGGPVRSKINNAMSYLYNAVSSVVSPLWEIVAGTGNVKPTNDRGIEAPTVDTAHLTSQQITAGSAGQVQVVTNKLRCTYLGGFGVGTRPLVVDSEGFVETDETSSGDTPQGRGAVYLSLWAEFTAQINSPVMFVNLAQNCEIALPSPESVPNAEFEVRKLANNAYAVTLNTVIEGAMLNHNIGDGFTTDEPGAYIRIKAVIISEIIARWVVVNKTGTWALT